MSETNDNHEEEQAPLTPEQIKEHKAKAKAFYDGEIPLLKKELQYHDLKASIEEAKVRELVAIGQYARIMNPINQQPEMGEDGFPVNWDEEMKEKWKKENPEEAAELEKYLAAKAEAGDNGNTPDEVEPENEEKGERTLAKE